MFDIAWTELMVIGAVALVVIGPKDLPKVLKTVGGLVNKARGMAREFQTGIDDMIRESELDEMRKAAKLDIAAEANKIFDPEAHKPPPVFEEPKAVELPSAGEAYTPPDIGLVDTDVPATVPDAATPSPAAKWNAPT